MRIYLTVALVGGLAFCAVRTARADDAPAAPAPAAAPLTDAQRGAEAKARYEAGMAHFQLEEWDDAIKEWQTGFRAKPVAQFLYNIAQAYRVSKRYDQALSYYQKYLRMDPKASNRPEVERHITSLTALVEQERKTQNQPPTQPLAVKSPPPKPGETPPEPPKPVEPPKPAVVAPPPPVVVVKEPEKPTPITKRKWFWPVVGAGAAVVVGVIIIGAVVGSSSSGGDTTPSLGLAKFP